MLKGIPAMLSPDLLKTLMEMGHGDEIVLADGNFPASACTTRLVRCDGLGIPGLLSAILRFLPLDEPVGASVVLMKAKSSKEIWITYRDIIENATGAGFDFSFEERFAFYERAKKAFAIVATSETALCGNIILKKGVVLSEQLD